MGGGRGFAYYNVFKKWLMQKCDLWQIAQELCGRGSHACSGLENTKVCKNCVCGAQSLHSRCVISVRGGKQRVPISPMARRYCPGPLNVSSPGSTRWRWWWAGHLVSDRTMMSQKQDILIQQKWWQRPALSLPIVAYIHLFTVQVDCRPRAVSK